MSARGYNFLVDMFPDVNRTVLLEMCSNIKNDDEVDRVVASLLEDRENVVFDNHDHEVPQVVDARHQLINDLSQAGVPEQVENTLQLDSRCCSAGKCFPTTAPTQQGPPGTRALGSVYPVYDMHHWPASPPPLQVNSVQPDFIPRPQQPSMPYAYQNPAAPSYLQPFCQSPFQGWQFSSTDGHGTPLPQPVYPPPRVDHAYPCSSLGASRQPASLNRQMYSGFTSCTGDEDREQNVFPEKEIPIFVPDVSTQSLPLVKAPRVKSDGGDIARPGRDGSVVSQESVAGSRASSETVIASHYLSLVTILPDSDPAFIRRKCEEINGSVSELQKFVIEALTLSNYGKNCSVSASEDETVENSHLPDVNGDGASRDLELTEDSWGSSEVCENSVCEEGCFAPTLTSSFEDAASESNIVTEAASQSLVSVSETEDTGRQVKAESSDANSEDLCNFEVLDSVDIVGGVGDAETPSVVGAVGDPEAPSVVGTVGDDETLCVVGVVGDPEVPCVVGTVGDPDTPSVVGAVGDDEASCVVSSESEFELSVVKFPDMSTGNESSVLMEVNSETLGTDTSDVEVFVFRALPKAAPRVIPMCDKGSSLVCLGKQPVVGVGDESDDSFGNLPEKVVVVELDVSNVNDSGEPVFEEITVKSSNSSTDDVSENVFQLACDLESRDNSSILDNTVGESGESFMEVVAVQSHSNSVPLCSAAESVLLEQGNDDFPPEVFTIDPDSSDTANDYEIARMMSEEDEARGLCYDPLEEKITLLLNFMPDADPSYLKDICERFGGDDAGLHAHVQDNLDANKYPTFEDYLERQETLGIMRESLSQLTIPTFLGLYPRPFLYFYGPRQKEQSETDHELGFLQRRYRNVPDMDLRAALDKCDHALTMVCKELDSWGGRAQHLRGDWECNMPRDIDLCFLHEVFFIENEREIREYLELDSFRKTVLERANFMEAKLECPICCEDDLEIVQMAACTEGHLFCKVCVQKNAETLIGDGLTKFPCLEGACTAEFGTRTLESLLNPMLFTRMVQQRSLEEVESAHLEDLVRCPFCEFAVILPPEDSVLVCQNLECRKETCRYCKEASHIPLRCDEVEKEGETVMRTEIEDKMSDALIRKCNSCGKKFIKSDGCNKMVCSCGAMMCYLCRKTVKDYTHFNGMGGTEFQKCSLFTNDGVVHYEEVKAAAERAKAEVTARNPGLELKNDPTKLLPTV